MKARTFRLSDSDIELLEDLANTRGESISDAIRYAIRNADNRNTCNTPPGQEYGPLLQEIMDGRDRLQREVEVLTSELVAKNEQIAALQRIAESAQETAKAAQVLQAQATMPELPDGRTDGWKERWRRFWNWGEG